jgi:antitoxin component HigA of HigAB toxin-antitoxin module
MDESIQRIKLIMEHYSMDKTMFCDKIGFHTLTLERIFKGRRKLTLNDLKCILKACPIINPDWLLLGIGDMLRT